MVINDLLRQSIKAYKNGDISAFNNIYNESSKYIYVCINNVLNGNDNKEDILQDVMQDTYVMISKHLVNLEDDERFLSWAGTIATRKCYEVIKKNSKYVYLPEDENFDNLSDIDDIIPEEVMQNKENQRLVREIISKELTEMQRLCIIGVYYNEMKQSEVAKELGIPENTVKSNLLRAKAKIKEAVVQLAESKDTKLYSVAPFMLLLFAEEIGACIVPYTVTGGVATAVNTAHIGAASATAGISAAGSGSAGVSAVTMGSVASGATQTIATAAGIGIKAKIAIIATSAIIGIGSTVGGIAIVSHINSDDTVASSQPIVQTQIETQIETQKEIEQTTEKEPEPVVKKDITETDYPLYKECIEWLLFDGESSLEFMKNITKYSDYVSTELISSETEERGDVDFNSKKVFPIFTKSNDLYIHKKDDDRNLVYGTYDEMIESMSTDINQTYYISYFNDKLSRDDVVRYVRESQGYANVNILSVDNESRVMKVYDAVHSCYYTCNYDIEGKITAINVEDNDKKRYRAMYDFLMEKTKEENLYLYGIRDINGDGQPELMLYDVLDTNEMYVYGYEETELKMIAFNVHSYFHTPIGITTDGYVTDESYYVETTGYYVLKDGSFSYTYEGYDEREIKEALYTRDFHKFKTDLVELFARTHGIKEDLEKEQAVQ